MMSAEAYFYARFTAAKDRAQRITRRDRPMLSFKFRRNIASGVIEPDKPTAAERFARVLALLNFEYDLPADVLAEAERVLQLLKARDEALSPSMASPSRWLRQRNPAYPVSRSACGGITPRVSARATALVRFPPCSFRRAISKWLLTL
jgi:hypothetical protein